MSACLVVAAGAAGSKQTVSQALAGEESGAEQQSNRRERLMSMPRQTDALVPLTPSLSLISDAERLRHMLCQDACLALSPSLDANERLTAHTDQCSCHVRLSL